MVPANSVIAQTFKSYPNGGDALSKKLADPIVANPKLASELVNLHAQCPRLEQGAKTGGGAWSGCGCVSAEH
jgi:hypothetical protein